jgi:Rad51 protein
LILQGDGSGSGFGSHCVIFIDAGNCSDIYRCVDFARQYGLDTNKILESIIASRPFTIHQLAGLIVHSLKPTIERFNANLVVIPDILSMFIKDSQIETEEARWLIKEIARMLKRLSSNMVAIVVSMSYNTVPQYTDALMRIFNISVDMDTNDAHPPRCIQVHVNDLRYHTIRIAKPTEKDLQFVYL